MLFLSRPVGRECRSPPCRSPYGRIGPRRLPAGRSHRGDTPPGCRVPASAVRGGDRSRCCGRRGRGSWPWCYCNPWDRLYRGRIPDRGWRRCPGWWHRGCWRPRRGRCPNRACDRSDRVDPWKRSSVLGWKLRRIARAGDQRGERQP